MKEGIRNLLKKISLNFFDIVKLPDLTGLLHYINSNREKVKGNMKISQMIKQLIIILNN
jgi:hypothetical protein